MPTTLTRWSLLLLLTYAAFAWRSWDLGARPMHSDEANQALKAGILLVNKSYDYDPTGHHGPVLYYAALPIAWLRGQHTLVAFDEVTVRLVPVIAGSLSVLLLGLLAMPLGETAALLAAAFLAVSPPSVYYSRFFIQETLLVTFTLGAFLCARTWWERRDTSWAVATGICLGLMMATKENAPLFIVCGLIAFLVARPGSSLVPLRIFLHSLACLASAAFVAAVFYSSFGNHPAGIADALRSYLLIGDRLSSGNTGQEKPWWYYLSLFYGVRSGGLLFEQRLFVTLVLGGFFAAVKTPNPLLRWAAVYTALVLLLLSVIPYKTPWHVIHLVPGFAILAAGSITCLGKATMSIAAGAMALVALCLLAYQADRSARTYASDPRNPYAYVHSSPDVLKFRALVLAAFKKHPGMAAEVVSEEYWPLPWYLRGLPVGYWAFPPENIDAAVVVASPGTFQAVSERLHGDYDTSYLGLRPGFVCIVLTKSP